jgi:hypothetical protein
MTGYFPPNGGFINAATQCEVCGRMGELSIFSMGGRGGARAAVPCADPTCPGRSWTVGRYGVPSLEGELQTILLSATPAELRVLGDLAARVSTVAGELERAGTPTGRALADWIRANEANFTAGSAAVALIALLCQLLMAANSGDNTTVDVDIDVTKIVVRDDGKVVIRED